MAHSGLPRVLAAGTQDAIDLLRRLLDGDAEVVAALSVEAAVQRLDPDISLILANIGFDDSRIFDFLAALDDGAYRDVPVVCFRMRSSSLPPAMEKSVELALAEIGIAAYVDLDAIEHSQGEQAAAEELRRRTLTALSRGAYNSPGQHPLKEGP